MSGRVFRFTLLGIVICIVGLLAWAFVTAPRHPVALLQVVDGAGKPIAGAIIGPEGLRTKPGPYVSGWYSWQPKQNGVPNNPVTTDAKGYAPVPYPKYVFERLETGTLCLSVDHPDYVPDRPERMVAHAPPAGSPWRVWFDYLMARVKHKVLVDRTDPIVLQKGAILRFSVRQGSAAGDSILSAQISGGTAANTNFWIRVGPGQLMTKRLRPSPQAIRAVQFVANGSVWFSPVTNVTALTGQTNELVLDLTPGMAVHGRLENTVPRPVRHGRVMAHVWPDGQEPANYPPDWHAWTEVRPDGSFEIKGLPEGRLELVAVCDGFVSTNGPGQFPSMHYPQKFTFSGGDLDVVLGMEPTASLEVMVQDDHGKPLKDAEVLCSPNVRYGEWSATVIGYDCYNTADFIRDPDAERHMVKAWWNHPPTFSATSDFSGLAVVGNLPAETAQFNIQHPRFALPALDTGFGQKRRELRITLHPPATNRITVRLEPIGQAPIAHY